MANPIEDWEWLTEGGPKPGYFNAQLHNFEFKPRKGTHGDEKMLRFTLDWIIPVSGLRIGERIKGCLAYKFIDPLTNESTLVWSPPRSRSGTASWQTVCPTTDWYELVLGKLNNSPFVKYIGGFGVTKYGAAAQTDPDLPVVLTI